MNNNPSDCRTYYALALDPIHVGTGGHRLGRVDMSIVREPGTNLPKIPGTSLAGACRTYAAMQEKGAFPHCAGQGQSGQGHCGQYSCPICVTFGYSKGDAGSFQGLAQFSDARLVLFPVHSLAGPVWVTCPDVLREMKGKNIPSISDDTRIHVASGVRAQSKLNLGWLMLDVEKNDFSLDDDFPNVPGEVKNRAVLASNKLFGHIVNDNLEVRTSVSIDPQTGAASEGALFTYEALPRASVLLFEVVVSDPKFYRINGKIPLEKTEEPKRREEVIQTVIKGLRLFACLGVGGMNTRGMGRLQVLGLDQGGAK